MSTDRQLTLGEVIAELEKHDPNKIVKHGFGDEDENGLTMARLHAMLEVEPPMSVVEDSLRQQVESLTGECSNWRRRHDEMLMKLQDATRRAADAERYIRDANDAPPVDTRKRLREYSDLADGDIVVIAGVPMTVHGRFLGTPESARALTLGLHPWFEDMLVDEVRRKARPKTVTRRVYEQIDDEDAERRALTVIDDKGYRFFRFVEETEVPG